MKELSSISKLEHIIYLVREYEKDITNQQLLVEATFDLNSTLALAGVEPKSVPSIEPQAEVYLERIEAFLAKD